jgi:p-hydroxybenzoate 3-monooxygenase
MRTQVGIVGAGPAGLLLSHLLHLEGIESVVLEARSRQYIEARIRAGVLEHGTVDLLIRSGLGERLKREALPHRGIEIAFNGERHRIDFEALTGGKTISVYAQHEVIADLVEARLAAGGTIHFEAEVIGMSQLQTAHPKIRYRAGGSERELECEFVAGCDGAHGPSRAALPPGAVATFERIYPFAWLGILAKSPPVSQELIYASHDRGFALFSMRTPEVSRLYLQCAPNEDLSDWPDERIWSELETRLDNRGATRLARGPILQRGVTPMRSFVIEPMQFGRLFLAGDAAHIVPPTGAKGLNLAVADIRVLARALAAHYGEGRQDLLQAYSQICLKRVWRVQHFSWWMTALLHRFDASDAFTRRLQIAELEQLLRSESARRVLAHNYIGLPFD